MVCPEPSPTRKRPKLEVADIFRAQGEIYRQTHSVTLDQLKVMHAIEVCRTEALGGHLDRCQDCGHSQPSYNSCRNRHCPKCQSLAQAKWIEKRMEYLLPIPYFHVVFTLPAALRPLCRRNPRVLYRLLFSTAAQTLLTLGEDKKRLGAQLGITAVLHTWTRELEFHPHVHCIVTGGGLSAEGTAWIATRRKYLFPAKVLSRLFRGLFLEALKDAHKAGEFDLDSASLHKLVDALYKKGEWVVYAKHTFGGPEQVFKYLGRYTHRVGISNQRLRSFDEHEVCFATKNGRSITLAPQEFIRRFLLHVLPSGLVKMRHYGLWASSNVSTRLLLARQLIPVQAPEASSSPPPSPELPKRDEPLTWQDHLLQLTGIDVTRCPHCGGRRMVRLPLDRAHAIHGRDTS